MTTPALIAQLHAKFCALVPEGACVLMHREHDWWDWLKWRPDQPFTIQDLVAVVRYRRYLIAHGAQFPACLKFSYLIGRPDLFEEDLSMARAQPWPRTNREAVLEASGRPQVRPESQRPPKMAGPLVLEALSKLREALR